jgi:hypothetical protein
LSGFSFVSFVWGLKADQEKRGAAGDALEATDRNRAGTVEGGSILESECTSRVIKFDSKQKTRGTK